MTIAVKRSATDQPGRMESHCAHGSHLHPYCALQELDPEDLRQPMCDTLPEDDKRLVVRTDEATFKLYADFVYAHGLPKGEFTAFSDGGLGALRDGQRDSLRLPAKRF